MAKGDHDIVVRFTYDEYIQSDAWDIRRRATLKRDFETCQRCGTNATEVHHKTYERIGHELPEDLESLCKPCHLMDHPDS